MEIENVSKNSVPHVKKNTAQRYIVRALYIAVLLMVTVYLIFPYLYNVVAHSWNYTVVISPDCYGRDLYLPVACSLLNIKKLHKTVC